MFNKLLLSPSSLTPVTRLINFPRRKLSSPLSSSSISSPCLLKSSPVYSSSFQLLNAKRNEVPLKTIQHSICTTSKKDVTDSQIIVKESRGYEKMVSGGSEIELMKRPLTQPQETMLKLHDIGETRGDRASKQIFLSSLLGGSFISWGASLYVFVGGGMLDLVNVHNMPGLFGLAAAFVFPLGLTSIVLTGSDLLTSNMMYATLPIVSKTPIKTKPEKYKSLLKLWTISFFGNLLSTVGFAYIASQAFLGTGAAIFAKGIVVKKTTGTALGLFTKGIGANWLVNLAVFQSTCSETAAGKMAVLWLPVTAFVALGLEHSVANMYLIPLGIFCGSHEVTSAGGVDLSFVQNANLLINNLIPVITGNAVGATVFVSHLHWHAFDMDKVMVLQKIMNHKNRG